MKQTNTILDKIRASKIIELDKSKSIVPLEELKKSLSTRKTEVRDFKQALSKGNELSLIAEIKKASPSFGQIATDFNHVQIAKEYQSSHLVDAISVITEVEHFQGNLSFIKDVKSVTTVPVFRKDFIFDEYQIYESFVAESDALLLIAAMLDSSELKKLLLLTKELGMNCMVETHSKDEIEMAVKAGAEIIGINARNLHTFEIDTDLFSKIVDIIPKEIIKVAESGLETNEDVVKVKQAGADAVLIGTSIMKSKDKKHTISQLLDK